MALVDNLGTIQLGLIGGTSLIKHGKTPLVTGEECVQASDLGAGSHPEIVLLNDLLLPEVSITN